MRSELHNCARCGNYHAGLSWHAFQRPVVLDEARRFTQWTICPASGDPILMLVEDVAGDAE